MNDTNTTQNESTPQEPSRPPDTRASLIRRGREIFAALSEDDQAAITALAGREAAKGARSFLQSLLEVWPAEIDAIMGFRFKVPNEMHDRSDLLTAKHWRQGASLTVFGLINSILDAAVVERLAIEFDDDNGRPLSIKVWDGYDKGVPVEEQTTALVQDGDEVVEMKLIMAKGAKEDLEAALAIVRGKNTIDHVLKIYHAEIDTEAARLMTEDGIPYERALHEARALVDARRLTAACNRKGTTPTKTFVDDCPHDRTPLPIKRVIQSLEDEKAPIIAELMERGESYVDSMMKADDIVRDRRKAKHVAEQQVKAELERKLAFEAMTAPGAPEPRHPVLNEDGKPSNARESEFAYVLSEWKKNQPQSAG